MDLIKAKCPKCQKPGFEALVAESEGQGGYLCAYCGGMLVKTHGLAEVLDEIQDPEEAPSHDSEADKRAGLCPVGHGLLIRARPHLEPGFYLDRCMKCGGIWFDKGEWERVAASGLTAGLPEIWSVEWQRTMRRDRTADHLERELQDRLGAELLSQIRDPGRKLASHSFRNQALAELHEIIRMR